MRAIHFIDTCRQRFEFSRCTTVLFVVWGFGVKFDNKRERKVLFYEAKTLGQHHGDKG
jgi:hypothetical protein